MGVDVNKSGKSRYEKLARRRLSLRIPPMTSETSI